jgi:alkanesulfonate monooxygenase SsuD/methylene tetrahydromethanopterin reductase-like flavin-dependent oxidoreductase (luciferase family)
LSCPDLVLAYIAARTKHIRLAPAVTVLPLHHPIRVAEQWATLDLLSNGRVDFADRPRLRPARIPAVPRLVRGQPGHLRRRPRSRAQAVGADDRISHQGKHYSFEMCASRQAGAEADPTYVGSFSKPRSSWRRGSIAA